MSFDQEMNRLRWQCRRGMLELDLFLNRFLETAYRDLNDKEKKLFNQLLACADQDLFEWLTGRSQSEDSDLQTIIALVRTHANPLC